MKLEEAKKLQGVFKSNLNKISRERYKSKEQPSALENIKLRYELQEAVIKLLNDYFSTASQVKEKTIHGKGIPNISARVDCSKVSNYSNFKILITKQMLQ